MKCISLMRYVLFVMVGIGYATNIHATEIKASLALSDETDLGLPIAGVVNQVHVRAGQKVRKNDMLLSLDCGLYQHQFNETLAIVDGLKPAHVRAKRDLELADDLYDRTVLSTVEHDEAKLKLLEATSRLDAAKARLNQARWRQHYCDLRAPFDAIVVATQINTGETVNALTAPQTLLTIANDKTLLAKAEINAEQHIRIKLGDSVSVTVNGKKYSATVSELGIKPLADKTEINYTIIVTFNADVATLRAGQDAIIHLP